MFESKGSIDLLGSVIANVNNILLIGIFLARLRKYKKTEYWLGLLFILSIIPLIIMFVKAFESDRAILYFIQLGLMISFVVLELSLDYILKIDFRKKKIIVIPYVTLFYAAVGGMIGVAGQNGKQWLIITVTTFLVMTIFSLIMHFKTGS